MQVVIDDLLVHYSLVGKGKAVLLLHGWGDSLAGFHDLQLALEKSFQVVSLDLPGFGQSQAPKTDWGLDEYALFVAHFLKKALTGKLYAVVGHSNGGAIAIRGLAQHVLEADRLVLLASAGVRGEYQGRVKAIRLITKTGKALITPLPHRFKMRLKQKVYNTVGSDMLVAEHLQGSFKKIISDDVREDAAGLQLPTLLINGMQDKSVPLSFGQELHQKIAGSQFEVIDPAEHFVHHDQPEAVLSYLKGFLK